MQKEGSPRTLQVEKAPLTCAGIVDKDAHPMALLEGRHVRHLPEQRQWEDGKGRGMAC